ncbi:MAG: DnaD domain protein [Chloroflexota bacterium]
MSQNTAFIGFPDKKMNPIVVPDYFFSDLLPLIDNLAELKLTMHCFWLLNEQSGDLRYLRGDDLRSDTQLLSSLSADDLRPPLTILDDALERTVARNTLLRLEITAPGEPDELGLGLGNEPKSGEEELLEDWYFMNTVKGRQTLALIRQGQLTELLPVLPEEAKLKVDRPIIFILYEQNVGMLSPMIADQLRDLEKTYPPSWIEEAFEIAVSRNARNLKYILAILKRWETDGRDTAKHKSAGTDTLGKSNQYERNGRPAGERRVPESGYDIPDDLKDIIIG